MSIDSQTQDRHHWHVLGAGALGCLWAARLWEASPERDVTFILRQPSELRNLKNAGGVRLHEHNHELRAPVLGTLISQLRHPIRYLLVSTKAQDAEAALASIAHLFNTETCIVLLQNGVKMQQQMARLYHRQQVYALSTSQGAYSQGLFEVFHAGFGQSYLGLLSSPKRDVSDRPETLLTLLPTQKMKIQWDANITSRLWTKFAINCAINALTVIHNCRNGELLANADIRDTLAALCNEIECVLQQVSQAPPINDLFTQVEGVLLATADNVSSTLQDARKGKPTEFEHFNPYLCELAQKTQTATPVNERIIALFYASLASLAD